MCGIRQHFSGIQPLIKEVPQPDKIEPELLVEYINQGSDALL